MAIETLDRTEIHTPLITDEMEYHANQLGIRIELVNGLAIWEASPIYSHQKKVDTIRASIRSINANKNAVDGGCGFISVADLTIIFPDGSFKRPDISIFCQEPAEDGAACTLVPEAVIEIISKGYEKKDLEIGLPFYLAQGIPDIVIFDPRTKVVAHHQSGRMDEHTSPVELKLTCGCRVVI